MKQQAHTDPGLRDFAEATEPKKEGVYRTKPGLVDGTAERTALRGVAAYEAQREARELLSDLVPTSEKKGVPARVEGEPGEPAAALPAPSQAPGVLPSGPVENDREPRYEEPRFVTPKQRSLLVWALMIGPVAALLLIALVFALVSRTQPRGPSGAGSLPSVSTAVSSSAPRGPVIESSATAPRPPTIMSAPISRASVGTPAPATTRPAAPGSAPHPTSKPTAVPPASSTYDPIQGI